MGSTMLEFHCPFVCMSMFSEIPPLEPIIVESDFIILTAPESPAIGLPSFWERQTQPSGRAAFLTRRPPFQYSEEHKTLMRSLRVLRIGRILSAELDPANAWVPFVTGPLIEALVPWHIPGSAPNEFVVFELYKPTPEEIASGTLTDQDLADAAEVEAWREEFLATPEFSTDSVLQFNE